MNFDTTEYVKGIVQKEKNREQAALLMCGALLGDSYMLMEMLDGLMVEAFSMFKVKKWWKQEIKHKFRQAHSHLKDAIKMSNVNSKCDSQYMRDVSDVFVEKMNREVFLLTNVIQNEFGRIGVKEYQEMARMTVIEIMIQYVKFHYEAVLNHMATIYPAYYDSWYNHASCRDVLHWWEEGMSRVEKLNVDSTIDLNKIQGISDGVLAFQNKVRKLMRSGELEEDVETESGCNGLLDDALNTLNVCHTT